jgi:Family of unknown function (DUF5947)
VSRLDDMIADRKRLTALARMRALAQSGGGPDVQDAPQAPVAAESCDLCGAVVPDEHRHLLHVEQRRIVCACEACWALRSGDPEYRPTGTRTIWLEPFDLDDELWGRFRIPIALAFFMRSSVSRGVVAFYPSPAGATESELSLEAWEELVRRNPILDELEADAEALIVNRLADPLGCAIAPIDTCYGLVGLIKSRWEGISGGSALREAVPEFFAALRSRAQSRAAAEVVL